MVWLTSFFSYYFYRLHIVWTNAWRKHQMLSTTNFLKPNVWRSQPNMRKRLKSPSKLTNTTQTPGVCWSHFIPNHNSLPRRQHKTILLVVLFWNGYKLWTLLHTKNVEKRCSVRFSLVAFLRTCLRISLSKSYWVNSGYLIVLVFGIAPLCNKKSYIKFHYCLEVLTTDFIPLF